MSNITQHTNQEKTLWTGTPSQWVNFPYYLLCIPLVLAFGAGLFLALYFYLTTKYNRFEITNQRIIEHKGILSRFTDELELYRVKDLRHDQPFFLRMLGLSNVVLNTTDHSNPVLTIKGVKNGKKLKEQLRMAVDHRRDIKGVREVDFK